ncbi:MAG: hypothetical protein H0X46_04460 [Bacteroidetes bacterium]|nr:hypothetical protein [Bacteroidota bacterium]
MDTEDQINLNSLPPKKSFWFLRFLKRLFIFLIISFMLIAGAGFVIGYYYQDEVKEYVIGELNKQLNTEIIVDGKDIDFTVIKNFPYASVDFKNVKAMDAIPQKNNDTLFTAGVISLQFNIIDIFKENYWVKKIAISDVDLNVRIDEVGNDNYHFWKESKDSATASFAFSLEKIDLKRIRINYKDKKANHTIRLLVKNSTLSGNFSDEKYSLQTNSELFVEQIKIDSTNYLRKKNILAEVELDVDNNLPSYKIRDGKIKIEDLLFEVFGNVVNAGNDPLVNFGVRGKNMDISSVLSLIPTKYKGKIKDYESDGEFYFDATIQGTVSAKQSPQIVADFGVKKADIKSVSDNITLKSVTLKGHYSNGNKNADESSMLTLQNFSAMIEQGAVEGELQLKDLDNPSFNGKVKANFDLSVLQRFVKIDTIETLSGKLNINAAFKGDGKSLSSGNYENVSTSGDLIIADMDLKLKNNSMSFSAINGDFKFDNNDLAVNSFTGNFGKSDFALKGFFRNIMGFILKENQDITVEASLVSKNIDLNELLANKEEDAGAKSKYKLKFSEHIDVELNSEIGHLVFRKFEATNIKGLVKLRDKKMIVDPIKLSTMGGTITTSGLVDGTDSTKLLVTCFSDVTRINVTRMFEGFENFGQSAITDKNIKGMITAKVQFASVVSPELDIDLDKLYAGVDMTIDNGELNNVESMKSMSRFIELQDLENIRFSTLKNQIEIKDQVISIPRMEVRSNAINITASGTHTFNNEINYKVKLSLNELLSKKAKNAKKENDEFGEIADDGLGRTNIFLSMTGTVEKPIIKYDSKSAIQNVKQDLKVEKQSLKAILKEEFGMFKKDSTLSTKKSPGEAKLTIKWEEDAKAQPSGKTDKKELKKPKKEEPEDF